MQSVLARVGVAALMLSALLLQPAAISADAPSGFVRVNGDQFVVDGQPFVMRGFNYYPRDYGWSAMTEWDWSEVDEELGLAASLGANTIRTVVDYGFSTGHPSETWTPSDVARQAHPTAAYVAAIERLLDIAQRHGLKVVLSLFDFMPGWAFIDQAQYGPATGYVSELVGHFADDPRVAAWDLLNEGDMLPDKFSTTDMSAVLHFYAATSAAVKAADRQHPVTADFAHIDRAYLSQDFVDYVSFHYYADQAQLSQSIDALRGRLRQPMPVVAGELGAPSAGNPYASLSSHTVALASYLDSALDTQALAGALVWTLVDPRPPRTPLTRQAKMDALAFGVFDGQLQPKPSAQMVHGFFTGQCGPDRRIELRFAPPSGPVAGDARYLELGLHQLTLVRADGSPASQVTFGTLEADTQEGRGFYANESWGQWAGDLGGTAALCVDVSPDAAALRLAAHALQSDTQVQVWVDGALRGTLTLQPVASEFTVPLSSS